MRGSVNSRTRLEDTKKRALAIPPDVSTRAIFQIVMPWPESLDFPPEIKNDWMLAWR